MKKIDTKAFTLFILVVVIAGLFYYTYLNDKSGKKQDTTVPSETEKLLDYDFENDYPKTVRETVKLHNTLIKYAYSGNLSDEELVKINKNIRQLFDEELLANNSESDQLEGLMNEIEQYEKEKKKIVSFTVAEGSQVEYNTEGETEYAKTKVTLVMKIESYSLSVDQEYLLRKDSEGRWKILGWQTVNNEDESN